MVYVYGPLPEVAHENNSAFLGQHMGSVFWKASFKAVEDCGVKKA